MRNFDWKITEISILTFNQWASTLRLFESLFKNTLNEYRVVTVFDNNSTDETRTELNKYSDEVNIIHNKENIGFGPGHNLVIRKSHADYIVIMNNDIEVPKNWLNDLITVAESDKQIGLVSPINRTGRRLILGGKLTEGGNGKHVHKGEGIELDWLQASCLLVKKEVFDRIGLFDEQFEMGYYEDVDFCLRAKEAGFKLVCAENVIIEHYEGVTSKPFGLKKYQEINREKFVKKWMGKL